MKKLVNRRSFLGAGPAALALAAQKPKLLLPSDEADELGFRTMWYNPVPPIDSATFQLRIHGMVEKPQLLLLSQLRRFPQETVNARLKCVQCWSSRTVWGGFRFANLIEAAKPKPAAKAVRIECADKWYEYFTVQELLSPRVLFVLDMAGKPLADRHGAPLRLVDPSRYGYKSAKLITSIEFVAEGRGSMACDIGPYYSPTGEIKAGYDHPLDFGPGARRRIRGGEIAEY